MPRENNNSTNSIDVPLAGRLLVVDDTATKQLKIAKAVERLGHEASVAHDGEMALSMLSEGQYDLILLDLVMPKLDGFEVLERLKADPALANIPVIVISYLSDMDSVVRAINLGAEDYLPESFDSSLLNVRVNTCLSKKWFRDSEIEYRRRTDLLISAAQKVHAGEYNPAKLGIATLLEEEEKDELGTLGKVFAGMAEQIFQRERRLKQQVHTLKSTLLLIATAAILGMGAPLSKLAGEIQSYPFSLALYVSTMVGVVGVGYALIRGRVPKPTKSLSVFLTIWGVITAVSTLALFVAAEHVSGATLSIILICEGFIVFAIAALLKMEATTPKRLLGIFISFCGVVLLIMLGGEGAGGGNWLWLIFALLVPLTYAFEDLLVAAKMPDNVDLVAILGLTGFIAALLLLPVTALFEGFAPLNFSLGQYELLIILLAAKTLIGMGLWSVLLTSSGAVFGSQVAYVKALAGIVWSMLLLNESLPLIAWLSFAVILLGLFLVESQKQEPEEIEIADAELGR